MRIWDLHPGYLNRQSLLGEHRELHGTVSIIRHNKKGYSKHPETLRWVRHGWALKQRHKLLVAEMQLRGYRDRSPVLLRANPGIWPETYIDPPARQIEILQEKYLALQPGRIPLPKNAQYFWAQHKYSVMARDIKAYQDIGKWVTTKAGGRALDKVALEVTTILRGAPEQKLVENTLLHMWGYVSQHSSMTGSKLASLTPTALLKCIQQLSLAHKAQYLTESTALSELGAWRI